MTSSRTTYDQFGIPMRGLGMLVVLTVALLALPRVTAAATIVVGDGTEASCTEAALQSALFASAADGGDVIRFNCGPNPVTITVTATTQLADGSIVALLPPNQTTIDGGNRITLTRSDWPGSLMAVATDTTVTIQNLTLQGAPLPYGHPDPNVVNRGTLSSATSGSRWSRTAP